MTFYKNFADVNEADLRVLKDSGEIEGLQLEFKRELPHLTSLVEEVVSFANTRGGDLFIGISENKEGTIELEGLEENPDNLILRIKQSIEAKTDPRLINVLYQPIPLTNGNNVIHVRVPRSWNAPHMVKDNSKFLIRTGSAKIAAGTSEIRSMMDQRGHFLERYERFRAKRAEKSLHVYHQMPPFIMLHYVPVSAFDITSNYPVVDNYRSLVPFVLGRSGANPRIHADGVFYQESEGESFRGHTQIFRNGIIEQVSNYQFSIESSAEEPNGRPIFYVIEFKRALIESLEWQIKNYAGLGMRDPFYIFVSMVGGMGVCGTRRVMFGRPQAIDEDFLILPEVLIETMDKETIEQTAATICTYFWNAFGYPKQPDNLI
ncbi:AlbA family DNA-binding domain-containing protein [Paenibacillus sp. NPDC093718]|uniref:AlbA family DNA-binding domain-containing protein n=1 Tax=Paenibacillus sp. NPDC093718 TaxID=3390601 RepID=UPI003CFEC8B8